MPHKKKLTAEDQDAAAARIRELWEANVNQTDIRATLAEEGWQLSRHDFYKLWAKDGLSLRSDRGFKPQGSDGSAKKTRKRRATQETDPFMAELVELRRLSLIVPILILPGGRCSAARARGKSGPEWCRRANAVTGSRARNDADTTLE